MTALNQVRRSKTYRRQAAESELRQDLTIIAGLDRQAEKRIRRYQIAFALGLVGAIVAFLAKHAIPALVYLAVGLGIVAAIALLLWVTQSGDDLKNYRYEFPLELLPLLERDRDESQPLKLKLLFTSPTDKRKQSDSMPHPYRSGWKLQQFRDSWLTLQGVFADGNQFELIVTERTQIASGWKRSRSGKHKHKRKVKCKGAELLLKFAFPRKNYAGMGTLKEDVTGAIQLPVDAEFSGVKASERALQLKVKVPAPVAQSPLGLVDVSAGMFLSLYQILNLARMMAKKST